MDNSGSKGTLEKPWVHNHFIKPSETFYLQIKVNKCTTKSGKMLHFALSIVVKYIHENTFIYIYYKIKINVFEM